MRTDTTRRRWRAAVTAVVGGQRATSTVRVPVPCLAVTGGDMNGAGPRRVAPGAYQIVVGEGTASFTVH